MPEFVTTNGHTQIIIPLIVKPYSHQELPTVTGNPFSHEAGAVLYGHYNMEYLLPKGDRLRLIANHNKKTVQLMLFTHHADLIQLLPGDRPSSLVANVISKVHRYRIRSSSYPQPLSPAQAQKLRITNECIRSLNKLLKTECHLNTQNHEEQEQLRRSVIKIIGKCSDKNHLLAATDPLISEGTLGDMLYEAYKTAQHHQFNRVYAVSRQDQMDFREIINHSKTKKNATCLVWDSELHIGQNNKDLNDALRVICNYYNLIPAENLTEVPANRMTQFAYFFNKLLHDGNDWANYLAIVEKPKHKIEIQQRLDGITITKITPYYSLKGFSQMGYSDLNSLIATLVKDADEPLYAKNLNHAKKIISRLPNNHSVIIAKKQLILIRLENKLLSLRYFVHDGQFYPLPDGQDLYTLGQISKRHLYLPERINLRLNAFASRIPLFFNKFYKSMKRFIIHDLYEDFFNHIHESHTLKEQKTVVTQAVKEQKKLKNTLIKTLENKGFLTNGQTLEEFIKEQISKSPYVIARPNHPPSTPAYENPFHRTFEVIRHIAGFFIDFSEKNPLIGSLAMAAYAYGGGSVLAPDLLKSILVKLHLNGLISGIEPTQKLAHWMSHGKISEAISASVTYWQGMVAGGNLDKFFVEAIKILQEDPAEIAIIVALALSLGYSLTKIIPALGHEMGDFPYTNYAALGGKSGAALYDTIMHPGDDWLLGTSKWLCRCFLTLGKLLLAPFLEWCYYGFHEGFLRGWKKSGVLLKRTSKHIFAASLDLLLSALSVPLLEFSALFIHVPFRGLTSLITKIFTILGNISTIGNALLAFSVRPPIDNLLISFKLSPLYGFNSPLGHYSENESINLFLNILSVLFLPPWQIIKNFLLLPAIDCSSFLLRLIIMTIDPLSRMGAYVLGKIIFTLGEVWDNSLGLAFAASARGMTRVCNWVEHQASNLKQSLLSFIENQRSHLFHWAFTKEDLEQQTPLEDTQYFTSAPMRYEMVPHSNSHCLLQKLLLGNETKSSTESANNSPHFSSLFAGEATNSTVHSSQNHSINYTL